MSIEGGLNQAQSKIPDNDNEGRVPDGFVIRGEARKSVQEARARSLEDNLQPVTEEQAAAHAVMNQMVEARQKKAVRERLGLPPEIEADEFRVSSPTETPAPVFERDIRQEKTVRDAFLERVNENKGKNLQSPAFIAFNQFSQEIQNDDSLSESERAKRLSDLSDVFSSHQRSWRPN